MKYFKDFADNLITMLRVKRVFFLQSHFEYFCLISIFPAVFMSQSASSGQVYEVSKIVFTSFMTSEARRMAVENAVLFGKRSIFIKIYKIFHIGVIQNCIIPCLELISPEQMD